MIRGTAVWRVALFGLLAAMMALALLASGCSSEPAEPGSAAGGDAAPSDPETADDGDPG